MQKFRQYRMQILIFCMLSLKMPIHAPKIGVLGDFAPIMGSSMNENPQKAHHLAETRRMTTHRSSKSVHFCALGASRRIKQKHVFFNFTYSPRPPTLSQRHMDLHVCDPIIYSKFHRNPFRGFGAPGGGSKFGLSHYFG